MSKVDRKTGKHSRTKPAKKLGWVVPAKRQPLFPKTNSPAEQASNSTSNGSANLAGSASVAASDGVLQPSFGRPTPSVQKPIAKQADTFPLGRGEYFNAAKRPIVSLYFLLPLILCYEIAKICVGVEQLSSGVDLWIHDLLCVFGAGQLVILPLLTTIVLLFHHHQNKDVWHVRPTTIAKMAAEAIGYGFMLFIFANLLQIVALSSPNAGKLVDPYYWQIGSAQWWGNVITYVGTGIHEELFFRVILMLPAIALLSDHFEDKLSATVLAVVGVGLLFALAHVDVVNPMGQPFEATSFAFRFLASCIFSAIFLYRGFGIVVGTHIIYNVLTLIA